MYAIIATGGKQYKVEKDEVLQIEKLKADVGAQVEFDKVLMLVDGENVNIGAPYLSNAKVTGEVVKHGRGEKVQIIKFRRRKHYMRHQGHRQDFTQVRISAIS
jgi:large subunit ribosomal protein L21